ncbi:MAG: hypothetical protein IM328_12695 [Microcystis sp. M034S1]|jgi:hypothetical protein|uniref:plasmid mobilization protein n=1 Tax=Microcystis sp. M034S1 TaxID=2771111 RepID=UPI00258CEE26|nr:hypothetical protein [Microcystis sp. M034S1]MCA2910191.1 hypothetical protein [Microcystis sp. M034S1]MCA6510455.1 hypothetical protein [Pseudanabaena sp. M109S1SP2A07QC]MCA6517787.1 hypothetical protein [Pseudanabaena sp. M110S1SP2A07QC]
MTQSMNTYGEIDQAFGDLDRKKDKYVSFRLLLSEVEDLKSMAKAENKNVSRFIRSRIFSKKYAA